MKQFVKSDKNSKDNTCKNNDGDELYEKKIHTSKYWITMME